MRIVVNDIAASSGGALTILESFYRCARDFGGDHEWVFLLGNDLVEETENIRTVVLPRVKGSWPRRLAFDLLSGRRLIRSLRPDVIFSLQNTYTYGLACPQVVYVHQPLPFQRAKDFSLLRRDERSLAIYQHVIGAIIKQSIRRADHVIVQTNWVRDAILDQVGIARDRVTSVLPDLEDLSRYKHEGPLDTAAFFYPTSSTIYKNNECVYAACRLLREQGVHEFTVTMTLDGPVAEPNINLIGRVPRKQVLKTLSRSTLVFPSYIETYGLPLAEARAVGSIVLAADLPYAREVLDSYCNAYFFDPASPDQLAALMRRVTTKSIAKSQVDEAGAPQGSSGTPSWARILGVVERFAYEGRMGRVR